MNPETKFAESPALAYWNKFMEYKSLETKNTVERSDSVVIPTSKNKS